MEKKRVYFVFLRYLILIVLGIPNLYLFYAIFTPLTVGPTFYLFSLIDSSSYILDPLTTTNPTIFFKGAFASIIPACVAGAAYYLLLILNLTTPMSLKKRLWSIAFLFGAFLIINLARIVLFGFLLTENFNSFDLAHTATWYFGSTIMVVLIWFANVLIFRIKTIPIYTDIKGIVSDIRGKSGSVLRYTGANNGPV